MVKVWGFGSFWLAQWNTVLWVYTFPQGQAVQVVRWKPPEMPGPCVGTEKWCSQRPLPRAALSSVPQKHTRVSTGSTAAQHSEMLGYPPRHPHPSFNPLVPCLPPHWNVSCLRAGPRPPCSSMYVQGPAQNLNLNALKKVTAEWMY